MTGQASIQRQTGCRRLGAAILAPVVVLALAYVLWWVSDRLVYLGPLDRAQFGWLVVVPLLFLAPVVAAFAWAGLTERRAIVASVVAGATIGLGLAFLFWRSVADPGCPTGNRFGPWDWFVPSLLIGAVFGASVAVSGLFASGFAREGSRRLTPSVVAVGTHLLFASVLLVIVGAMLSTGMCERPQPIG